MRLFRLLIGLVLLASALAACGTSQLLANVGPATAELRPSGKGEHVDISYTVGQPAKVAIYLQAADGARYNLRAGERRLVSSDPYVLRFDGTAPTNDPVLKRRALPSGSYTYVVQATGDDGAQAESKGQIMITGSDSPPPMIENLVVAPATISPNADGIDDVAEITYHLPVSATVDITFKSMCGTAKRSTTRCCPMASTPTLCARKIASAIWSSSPARSQSPAAVSPKSRF